jgi:hypothetical protein
MPAAAARASHGSLASASGRLIDAPHFQRDVAGAAVLSWRSHHAAFASSRLGALLLRLLDGHDDDDNENEELSFATAATRRKVLDRLDRTHVGASARTLTSIERGGGAHTVNHCPTTEIARLKAIWQ